MSELGRYFPPEPEESIEEALLALAQEKMGINVEDLYNLTLLKSMGVELTPAQYIKKWARGSVKNILRLLDIPEKTVRRVIPLAQVRFIKSYTDRLTPEEKNAVDRKLVVMERGRICEEIEEMMKDAEINLMRGIKKIYVYGSMASEVDWPNDVDIIIVANGNEEEKKISTVMLQRLLQERTNKRVDIKKIISDEQEIKNKDISRPDRKPILVWSKE